MIFQQDVGSNGTLVELSRAEILGLIFLLNSIMGQTEDLDDPSLDHPGFKTSASIRPLMLRLVNSAVNAEYLPPMLCVRPTL